MSACYGKTEEAPASCFYLERWYQGDKKVASHVPKGFAASMLGPEWMSFSATEKKGSFLRQMRNFFVFCFHSFLDWYVLHTCKCNL